MSEWMKDWESFDFDNIKEKLEEAEKSGCKDKDIGISREELIDLLKYLQVNDEEVFYQGYFMQMLIKKGLSEEDALLMAENMDIVAKVLGLDE